MKSRLQLFGRPIFLLVVSLCFIQTGWAQVPCDTAADPTVVDSDCPTSAIDIVLPVGQCNLTIDPADASGTLALLGINPDDYFTFIADPSLPTQNLLILSPATATVVGAGTNSSFVLNGQFVDPNTGDCLGDGLCTFTINVLDQVNPMITCPDTVVVSASANPLDLCTATVTSIPFATATDDCTPPTITNSYNANGANANDTYPLGTTIVTFTATDASGNAVSCNTVVIVEDNTAPTVTCPGGTVPTINAPADPATCSAAVTVPLVSAGDNCTANPVISYTLTGAATGSGTGGDASGTYPVGTTTITYTVTDAAGNTGAACSINVVVADATPPAITACPADITVSAGATCDAFVNVPLPTVTEDCAFTITNNINGNASASDTYSLGSTIVTYAVTNANGAIVNCSLTVTVEDTTGPTVTCPTNVVVPNDAGQCDATVTIPVAVPADNCVVASITNDYNAGGADASGTYPVGSTTVTYTVTDGVGMTATCSFVVMVTNNDPVSITCPADLSFPTTTIGDCNANVTGLAPTITTSNSCPTPSYSYNLTGSTTGSGTGDASGATFNSGTTTVTYSVPDGMGGVASCSFDVTIVDTQNPSLICPSPQTVSTDLGACTTTISNGEPMFSDNCGAVTLTYTLAGATTGMGAGNVNGIIFNQGITTVTYTATDAAGNTSDCDTFIVTVDDNEAPTIACAMGNITLPTDAGACTTVVNNIAPGAVADNCTAAMTLVTTYTITGALVNSGTGDASGTAFPIGTSTVTYTVTDGAGMTASCTFDVTIQDVEGPSITCPVNIVVETDGTVVSGAATAAVVGACETTVNFAAPVGTDPGGCGTGAVTTQTDATGLASGDNFPVGTTTLEYTVTDGAGNTAVCSFTITVVDVDDPVAINCPSDVTISSDASGCSASYTWQHPTFSDGCPGGEIVVSYGGPFVNITPNAGMSETQVFPAGTTTVSYVVTDASGNSNATCTFDITVEDNEAPTISCPTNVSVVNQLNVCGATVNNIGASVSDNCGVMAVTYAVTGATTSNSAATGINDASGTIFNLGTSVVTYTVTDAAGNVGTCSFTIDVQDTEAPIIVCPVDQTVSVDPGTCATSTVNNIGIQASNDNCSIVSITYEVLNPDGTMASGTTDASGYAFAIGTSTVTYTAVDGAGNDGICEFMITVEDDEDPVINFCPLTDIVIGTDGVVINGGGFVGLVNTTPDPVPFPKPGMANNDACTMRVTGLMMDATDNCGIATETFVMSGAYTGTATPATINTILFGLGTTNVTYTVVDTDGNTATCTFAIEVVDNEAPSLYQFPLDRVVANDAGSCFAVVDDLAPLLIDNCPLPELTAIVTAPDGTQTIVMDDVSGYAFPVGTTTVEYQFVDAAGNSIGVNVDAASCSGIVVDEANTDITATGPPYTFTVTVNDSEPPVLVSDAADASVDCDGDSQYPEFLNWFRARAGFVVSDNCDVNYNLVAPAFLPSTDTLSYFNTHFNNTCGFAGDITVTWTATDPSGNVVNSTPATFSVVDNVAPTFQYCPANITVNTSDNGAGDCIASATFDTPIITDDCLATMPCTTSDIKPIVSAVPGDPNTVVNTVILSMPVPVGTVATGPVLVDINLIDIDGEFGGVVSSTEFFFVVNENGDTLATTTNIAPGQCTNSTTTYTFSASQFNQWAQDGSVTFTLYPFDPTGTVNDNEGINDICTNSMAEAVASYPCANLPTTYGLTYMVDVDNDGVDGDGAGLDSTVVNVPLPATGSIGLGSSLGLGTHSVTYEVTDCNGNTAACSFLITVVDDEMPSFTCAAPLDTMTNTALTLTAPGMYEVLTTSCDVVGIALQRPTNLFDNCGFSDDYSAVSGPSFLTFGPHPNIDQPVAADASLSFSVPAANAIMNGTLTITFQGDFNNPSDYMEIQDENGNPLAVIGDDTNTTFGTSTNVGTCAAAGSITITVTPAQLNMWAADGVITFNGVSNVINIAPAPPGPTPSDEGVNPCGPLGANGEDGISNIMMQLSYPAATASYAVSNATTIGTTAFPANGMDPIVSLVPGFNDVDIMVTDINGNTDTCSYTIDVQSFALDQPSITASSTSGLCSGDLVTLTATNSATGMAYPAGLQYEWFIETDGMPGLTAGDVSINTTNVDVFNINTLPNVNTYYVQVRDASGCISPGPVGVSINGGQGLTIPNIYAINNPICEGGTFGFGLSNTDAAWTSYTWYGPNGYTSTVPNPPFLNNADELTNQGQYYLVVEDANGCSATSNIAYVEIYEAPEQPSIQASSAVCNGDAIVLSSSTVCDSYIWIGPDGNSSSTLANPLLQTTTNSTTIPVGNSAYDAGMWSVICVTEVFPGFTCQSAPSEQAAVAISSPIAVAPSNSGPACTGQSVTLTVGGISSAASYSWTGPNGFTSTAQNPVLPTTTAGDAGTYSVVVTDVNGCVGGGSTALTVGDSPVVTAVSVNPPAGSCVTGASSITLNPTVTPLSTNYTYTWTGPNGFTSTSAVPTLPNGTSVDNGSYTLVVSNGGGGCASAPMTVVVDVSDAPATPSIAANAQGLCEGGSLTFTTSGYSGSVVTYDWYMGSSLVGTTTAPSFTIPSVNASNSGNYSVIVTTDGCTSNSSQMVPVAVSAEPAAPVVTAPVAICAGEILSLETTLVPGATYSWTGPNGFTASVYNPSVFPVTAASAGAYQVQVLINGCASALSAPTNVAVNAAPQAPTADNNGPICMDDAMAVLTLSVTAGTAIPGATYEWFDAATNNSIGTSGLSTNFNLTNLTTLGEGVYDYYVVATMGGCSSSTSIPTSVVVNTMPTAPAFAGSSIDVCDGLTTALSADAPTVGMGTWTQVSGPPASIISPNAPNSTISALVGGNTYTFRWTLSNGGCGDYSTDDVVITVDEASQAAEAGNFVQVCNVNQATLAALPANTGNLGKWTQSATQSQLGVLITDPNDPNTTVTGLQPGNTYQFTWTLSNAGCGVFASDIVEVNVADSQVTAFAGADVTACGDADAIVTAEPTTGCTGEWSSPDPEIVFVNPNDMSTVVMDLKPGQNTLVWTVDCGACGSSSDEVVIMFEDAPAAVNDVITVPFSGLGTVVVTDNDDLAAGGYSVNVLTQPINGTLTQTSQGVYEYTHTGTTDGADQFTYELCSANCPDVCTTAQVGITINVDNECTVPTIFTPNGDGINDDFVVQCLFASGKYPNNVVTIFNEWGDEVFTSMPYNNDWQGTYNGADLPVGTYFYIVDLGDGSVPMSGFLVLER